MNNSQLLIIHKYPILFNILNENKSTLKFKILQINEDKIDINTSYENLVIISSDKNFRSKLLLKFDNYPLNINKLIEEVNDTSKDENKSIIFKTIGKNEINHKCKYIALKRCIINIINNAKAYGDKIIIKLSESDNKININIEDNGPGISKKDYQKALKPFQRLDSSRNQNIAGSGLGLSISQDIIKTLDGDLNLSKSEIGGLKVEINLPKIS